MTVTSLFSKRVVDGKYFRKRQVPIARPGEGEGVKA